MSLIPGKLDSNEIRQKIRKTDFPSRFTITEEETNDIIQMFWRQDAYNSLISFPAYLEHLINFLKEKRKAVFTRSEFYSYLIKELVESKETLTHLLKIAVVMELAQVNDLSITDFDDVLKRLNIKKTDVGLRELKKKRVIKVVKKENGERAIAFYHHTIQEYLAAQLILRRPEPLEATKDYLLIDQEGIIAIKPSWYGVLRFLLESNKAKVFIDWMLELATDNPDVVDEGFSNAITSADPERIPKRTREAIFDLVYATYQNRQIWMPLWSRQNLAYLCGKKHLERFRKDIKQSKSKTETFVRRGNIADIVSRLLEIDSPLMTSKEKVFWKNKFIKFANDDNENGVLQRQALAGLATYHNPQLISQVKKCFDHPGKLVREAFVQFCYEIDPNDKRTIRYLVEGVKKGIDIYGRYGVYEIDGKEGIKELLKYFAKDGVFLRRFLDRESIFNDRGKKADKVLIDHIKAVLDQDILNQLKAVIRTAFQTEKIYHHEKSYFLKQVISIVKTKDPNYLFETVEDIKKSDKDRWRLLCNYENLFAMIIKKGNLKAFFEQIKELDDGKTRVAEITIYKARHIRGKRGERIYQVAVRQGLIEPLAEQPIQRVSSREEGLYKEFKNLLEPEKGKYFPTVFEFVNQNHKELEPQLTKRDRARLIKLVVGEGLKKTDPKKIKVKILDKENEPGRYNISSTASYYGDVLRCAQKLLEQPQLGSYRQNIINFIPFAYSEDQQTIHELVGSLSDDDLGFVNEVYLDMDRDIRYLLPSSYIYTVKIYTERGNKLETPSKILKSFIEDPLIGKHDQKYALEQYGRLINSEDKAVKEFLKDLFLSKINSKQEDERLLAEIANAILINKFKDEKAIKWRFDELKKRVAPFDERSKFQVHAVGQLEEELNSLSFAKPLIELRDIKYSPYFIDLLEFLLTLFSKPKEEELEPYTNYLWRVVSEFIERLKISGSFKPVMDLEKWLQRHKDVEGVNWLSARVIELKKAYTGWVGKPKSINEAINSLPYVKKI